LPLIETLPIGSRPSRRTASPTFEDLRAIPFTFAWNQVRLPINAFYGLGSAFDALTEPMQQQAIAMYQTWPWFQAVIDNAELALARCDPAIARRYAALADDPDAADRFWQQLREEFERTRQAVLTIKQQRQLLDDVPWLQRTFRVRTPYLDMLNLVQVELLTRQRPAPEGPDGQAIEQALRQNVQAIAAGLRNTG
jgi:phosphoenolpyruvate carboxylase